MHNNICEQGHLTKKYPTFLLSYQNSANSRFANETARLCQQVVRIKAKANYLCSLTLNLIIGTQNSTRTCGNSIFIVSAK
jgi:hypothetical protein